MNEDERQLMHALFGIFSMLLVAVLGRELASYALSVILLFGLILVHVKFSYKSIGLFEHFIKRFDREGVVPGYGALTFVAGALAITTLLESVPAILASLFILGIGDAVSNVVGRRSRRKLPYNRKKTMDGTAAFFLSCIPAVLFAGPAAILVAGAAALAESLESNVDDNLIISVVCVVLFRLVG